jgi:hypothetical protein
MEQIVAERYYDQTKQLIQRYIDWKILSDNDRDRMISFYQLLNVENAKITYQEVNSLLNHAEAVNNQKLDASHYKFCRTMCLTGMAITFIATMGLRRIPRDNYFYNFLSYTGILGASAVIVSVINLL